MAPKDKGKRRSHHSRDKVSKEDQDQASSSLVEEFTEWSEWEQDENGYWYSTRQNRRTGEYERAYDQSGKEVPPISDNRNEVGTAFESVGSDQTTEYADERAGSSQPSLPREDVDSYGAEYQPYTLSEGSYGSPSQTDPRMPYHAEEIAPQQEDDDPRAQPWRGHPGIDHTDQYYDGNPEDSNRADPVEKLDTGS